MPYLIEKSDGTRTQVEMSADEARFKAQTQRVIEIHADGSVIGDVQPESTTVHEDTAQALDAAFSAIGEKAAGAAVAAVSEHIGLPADPKPTPARKTTTKAKK